MDGGGSKHAADDAAQGHAAKAARLGGAPHSDEVSIIFSITSHPGALQEALGVFKTHNLDLSHIESRPSKKDASSYEFFASIKASQAIVKAAVADLEKHAHVIAVLDHNPDTSNPMWFPRRIRELDLFAHRVLGACSDLESDHPGFHDPVYRTRRNYFADIATKYTHDQPLPRVDYTPEEVKTW